MKVAFSVLLLVRYLELLQQFPSKIFYCFCIILQKPKKSNILYKLVSCEYVRDSPDMFNISMRVVEGLAKNNVLY